MRHRHMIAVDRVGVGRDCDLRRIEMGDDLVAEKVEIDPLIRVAALGAAERAAIEGAGGLEIVDGKGEVEGGKGGHATNLAPRTRKTSAILRRPVSRARRAGLPLSAFRDSLSAATGRA